MPSLKDYEKALDPTHAIAARLLVENQFKLKNERKTMEVIAAEVGVSRQSLHNWQKSPDFIRYMDALSEQQLAIFKPLVDSQLIKSIRGDAQNNGLPSQKALELYYKLIGRLAERHEMYFADKPTTRKTFTEEEYEAELEELAKLAKKKGEGE
ncbi:phBC6A51 family helix-turn-helix protein [Terribacillus sp. 179-K 1B1 HS]|uniref:phBC6A51 family helix-turn-helix protein n=1 Tax=Terribacillus sp. 179-K 1B1 HS TaxID=3142388 RepID=UPI0039A17347